MELVVVEESAISAELDEEIRHGLVACFAADRDVFSKTRAWHGSAPAWCVVLRQQSRVAAHAGVVDRIVAAGDEQVRVAGIQNVYVLPDFRGLGLSDRIMERIMEEAGRRNYDCGLLFCVPAIEKVYARCGWIALPDSGVVRLDETGAEAPIPGKNIAMYYPLKRPDFPPGRIHLQGNDW